MSKVLTNLVFKSSTPVLDEESDFPSTPVSGQFCFKGGILYIYATVDSVETWYPLTNKSLYAVHTQALTSTSWVVTHSLKTEDLIFMVYDENDVQIIPSSVVFDSETQITLNFVEAIKGRCVVFGASESFVPALHTAEMTIGDSITISGTSIVVSGDDIVSILNQTKSDLDAMFSWNESQGEITFKGDLIPENTNSLSIGSETKKIKDVYISASTLHVGDNATFEGTSLAIDAGPNPTSLAATPTIQASSLVLKPFTYNPGAGDVNVEPVLRFQNLGGQQYGISFNLINNQFQLDSPSGVGTGSLKAQDLTVANKITADTIETTGTAQVKFDQTVRMDGNVTLGYDSDNDIVIRGSVDLQTPITFSQAATLGDGNDTISVNCGAANNFTVVAQHVNINSAGKLTAAEIESSGNLTVQGDLFVNGTQTIIDTTTLTVTDNVVVVNNGEAGAGITAGTAGISVDRGSLPDAKIIYNEATDKWQIGIEGSMVDIEVSTHTHDTRYLRANDDSKPSTDNVFDLGASDKRFANVYATTFNGALNGLSSQATALETSRTISLSGDVTGSAGFDGTANASITATVVNDSHTHDTRYFTETEQNTKFLRRDADTTPSSDVTYDLGDATHRWTNIHATNFKGNADTASKWANARTVYLSGGLSGSFDIDGSGNINASIPVVNDSHTHDTQYAKVGDKGANDGYAGLNSSGHVPASQLGSGTPDGTKYLRDDLTWQVVDNNFDTSIFVGAQDGANAHLWIRDANDSNKNKSIFYWNRENDVTQIAHYASDGTTQDGILTVGAAQVVTPNNFKCKDIYADRGDGTGVIFFGSAGDRYLHYINGVYNLVNADLKVNGTRVPKHSASTGAPSGGVDGDIHMQYS
jgi:hypothetical protein